MRTWLLGLSVTLLLVGGAAAQSSSLASSAGLIQLHDDLKLTPDQEPAWRDYTAAIAPTAQARTRHQAATQLIPQLPTPRRIALIEATMNADNADFHRQGEAVDRFYDRLSPNQQMIFDRDTLGPTPGGGDPGQGLRQPPPR